MTASIAAVQMQFWWRVCVSNAGIHTIYCVPTVCVCTLQLYTWHLLWIPPIVHTTYQYMLPIMHATNLDGIFEDWYLLPTPIYPVISHRHIKCIGAILGENAWIWILKIWR